MKKIVLLLLVSCFSVTTIAQKNKAAISSGFAKADNLVVEVKSANFQLTINENGKPKEAIIVKPIDTKFTPINTKIIPFTANGVKLYLLTWTEEITTTANLSTEKSTIVYSNIYDVSKKKEVYTNKQVTILITEKVFLDANKTASETRQKVRREGFEFVLNPEGSITQKSKNKLIKLHYNVEKMVFAVK